MTETVQVQDPRLSRDDFAAMLDEQFGSNSRLEGTVVKGTVVDPDNDEVVVDVGLKSEGRVPLKEFGTHGQPPEVRVGDRVDVYVERFEKNGQVFYRARLDGFDGREDAAGLCSQLKKAKMSCLAMQS